MEPGSKPPYRPPYQLGPAEQDELECEGCRGWYPATQAAAATSEILAENAESVQTFNTNWQLPVRQSQPESPEVTEDEAVHTRLQHRAADADTHEKGVTTKIDEQESRAHHRLM